MNTVNQTLWGFLTKEGNISNKGRIKHFSLITKKLMENCKNKDCSLTGVKSSNWSLNSLSWESKLVVADLVNSGWLA